MLYLLSSPIGNLQDITQRFIDTLHDVDVLYWEDTRVTGNLLHKLQIKKPLLRYDEHVEQKLIPEIVGKLQAHQQIGLISDAGVPTLSDPGFKLVRECLRNNIKVINIPGPSAVTTALVVSGFPTDHFMFFGFLPKTDRIKFWLERGATTSDTVNNLLVANKIIEGKKKKSVFLSKKRSAKIAEKQKEAASKAEEAKAKAEAAKAAEAEAKAAAEAEAKAQAEAAKAEEAKVEEVKAEEPAKAEETLAEEIKE